MLPIKPLRPVKILEKNRYEYLYALAKTLKPDEGSHLHAMTYIIMTKNPDVNWGVAKVPDFEKIIRELTPEEVEMAISVALALWQGLGDDVAGLEDEVRDVLAAARKKDK